MIRQYESENTYRKGQRSLKEFEIRLEEVRSFGEVKDFICCKHLPPKFSYKDTHLNLRFFGGSTPGILMYIEGCYLGSNFVIARCLLFVNNPS